jgi:hypothetical protein
MNLIFAVFCFVGLNAMIPDRVRTADPAGEASESSAPAASATQTAAPAAGPPRLRITNKDGIEYLFYLREHRITKNANGDPVDRAGLRPEEIIGIGEVSFTTEVLKLNFFYPENDVFIYYPRLLSMSGEDVCGSNVHVHYQPSLVVGDLTDSTDQNTGIMPASMQLVRASELPEGGIEDAIGIEPTNHQSPVQFMIEGASSLVKTGLGTGGARFDLIVTFYPSTEAQGRTVHIEYNPQPTPAQWEKISAELVRSGIF